MKILERVQAIGRDLASARGVVTNRSVFSEPISVTGNGRPIVLLHGFMGHPSSLELFALSAIERDHTVIAPQGNPTDTVNYQISGLYDLIESLDSPVHIVGHSLGGVVAVLASMERPELFASIVTIASPLGGSHWAKLPLVRQSVLAGVHPEECAARKAMGVSVPLFSVAGEFDPLVTVNSALALSTNGLSLEVPEGHASILWSPRVVDAATVFQVAVDKYSTE